MIDVRKLQRWRRPELEAITFLKQGQLEGDVAGDAVISVHGHLRSIRFSLQQERPNWHDTTVSLSAEGHTRCTDVDVSRFMKYLGVVIVAEAQPTVHMWMRHFAIKPRRGVQ